MTSLSVIIIAKNEAHIIRHCLESIQWADEIIVLDSGSTDGTQAICQTYNAKVFETDWPGYGKQKNRALAKATGDWVLSLDADECVTGQLREQISQAIASDTYQGYTIPMETLYCGKPLKGSGCTGAPKRRLFKNGCGMFDDAPVHENLALKGKMGKLTAPIRHYTYENLEEVIYKLNHYSTLGAKVRFDQGKKGGLLTAIGHGIGAFFRTYILKRGFLDGAEGFMISVSNAEYAYYRYLKLMYLIKGQEKCS